MLKITSGIYNGRKLAQPKTDKTRPVMERTRHAIFQVLGDLTGLDVLDLYAGSGALGLEALSLGANSATFVDKARVAIDAIKTNCQSLKIISKVVIINSKVEDFIKSSDTTSKYDIIFFDPPYVEIDLRHLKIATELLSVNGIIVVSCAKHTELPMLLGKTKQVKIKIYGDTQIAYYQYKSL